MHLNSISANFIRPATTSYYSNYAQIEKLKSDEYRLYVHSDTNTTLKKLLCSHFWTITNFAKNKNTAGLIPLKYILHFSDSGLCFADDQYKTLKGLWICGISENELILKLIFPTTSELAIYNHEWIITFTSENLLSLKSESGNKSYPKWLVLKKP